MRKERWSVTTGFWALGLALFGLAGCGKSGTPASSVPNPVVAISVSPASGSVQVGTTLAFSASVSGATNTGVAWQVGGVTGGSASGGSISSSGLYTAPASVPSPTTVTVTAVSSADSTKTASAIVTVLPAPRPAISVTLTPSTAGVITLYSQQFTATVANTTNTAVVWSVNGASGGSSQTGTISASGLYTAPSFVPSSPVVTVTATSVADNTKSATASVTIQPPPTPTGTWSSLGPAGASYTMMMAPDPKNAQTMYGAPTYGGLYKTTNLGQTWTSLITPTGYPFSVLIAPASGTLYVFSESHFQTSTDGGKTFSANVAYPNSLDTETTPVTFAIDPKNDQTLYLMTTTPFLRSKDGGLTWTNLTAPPSPNVVSGVQSPALGSLTVSSSNSSVLMATSATGVAVSKDGGITWQMQNNGLDPSFSSVVQILQDPITPSRLLCLSVNPSGVSPFAYVYVSSDSGVSWTKSATVGVYDRLVAGQSGTGIYVISSGSLYVTFNAGASYKNIGPMSDSIGYGAVFSPITPLVMAYQGYDDIFVSQDGGATWTISEVGINSRSMGRVVYAGSAGPLYTATLLPVFAGNPTLGGAGTSTLLWHTSDPSQPWTRTVNAYSQLPILDFDVDSQNPQRILGLEQTSPNGTPASVLSTDGGSTWTTIPYATGMASAFLVLNPSAVRFGASGTGFAYACGTFGVARLSIAASTWMIINNGIPSTATCTALGVDQATVGTVYASTNAGLYKSTDGGNNWSLLTSAGQYASILIDPQVSNNIFLSVGVGGSGYSMRSTNGGKTWAQMSVGGQIAFNPTARSIMYGVDQNHLYASYDSGLTWASITPPVPFLEDIAVTAAGAVIISTFANGVVEFIPR